MTDVQFYAVVFGVLIVVLAVCGLLMLREIERLRNTVTSYKGSVRALERQIEGILEADGECFCPRCKFRPWCDIRGDE